MRRNLATIGWLGICLAIAVSAASAEDAPGGRGRPPIRAMNKKFTDPNADIHKFVKLWETEARDVYVKRREITRAVGLHAGEAVADVGAGTGLFTELFAAAVGPKGRVYAVDISPVFIKYIGQQAKQRGLDRTIKTILNKQDSTELPAGSVDVAFLCDTYHHFEHPAKMLASIHRALRPGGRLVIIDFDLRKDSDKFVKKRARAAKEVYFREIAAAGFEQVATKMRTEDQRELLRRVPPRRAKARPIEQRHKSTQEVGPASVMQRPIEMKKTAPAAGYPPEPGCYLRGNDYSPVAVVVILRWEREKTPPSIEQLVRVAVESGAALAGTLQTENIGLEKVICNLVANPNVRFLVVCGPETPGHLVGDAILSLAANGVDAEKRIVAAKALTPYLYNVPLEFIERFRRQVTVIDLVDEGSPEVLRQAIQACYQQEPTPFGKYVLSDPALIPSRRLAGRSRGTSETPRRSRKTSKRGQGWKRRGS